MFRGGRGVHGLLSSASFTKRIVGWTLRMRLTCGDRFSCSPCSGCAYFRTGFPGGGRRGAVFCYGFRPVLQQRPLRSASGNRRTGRGACSAAWGGKNDRHKRRGCLTRCRRPFFIRTAIRELFRIRNFGGSKKLVRQPPPLFVLFRESSRTGGSRKVEKIVRQGPLCIGPDAKRGSTERFSCRTPPPRSAVRRTPPVSGARSRTNRSGTRRRRVAPHRCRP